MFSILSGLGSKMTVPIEKKNFHTQYISSALELLYLLNLLFLNHKISSDIKLFNINCNNILIPLEYFKIVYCLFS
jgi:hypothetical protein